MIPGKYRFHGLASLRYLHRNSKIVRCSYFAIKYNTNSRQRNYRAAIVVSKKVSKSAVVRNRIRRRLYEIIRRNSGLLVKPVDMAVIVYDVQLAVMDFEKLEKITIKLIKTIQKS